MAELMKWLNDWLGFFKPLQVRNLQIFWSGQAAALIGMWLQVTAMGILVYDISGGSATAVGFLAALNALPFFLGGMLLAGLGDRFDRRKLLIAVQCVQWLVAVALFLLTMLDMLQLWHLYAAGLVMGVNQTVGFPTQQAFVGDLIPRRQLQEAVGMYSLVFNTCRAVGPALAGYIIAEWGAGTAFGGNVVASLPLVGCLVALKGRVADTSAPKKQRGAGRKASGLKAVLSTRSLLFIMISALIQNICGQSLYQIVPALMHGNPRNTGLILGAVGAGAMVSILFVLPFARKATGWGPSSPRARCGWGAHYAWPASFPWWKYRPSASSLPVWLLLPSLSPLHPPCSFWRRRNANLPFWGCSASLRLGCSLWRPWAGEPWWMFGESRRRSSWREGWKPCSPSGC